MATEPTTFVVALIVYHADMSPMGDVVQFNAAALRPFLLAVIFVITGTEPTFTVAVVVSPNAIAFLGVTVKIYVAPFVRPVKDCDSEEIVAVVGITAPGRSAVAEIVYVLPLVWPFVTDHETIAAWSPLRLAVTEIAGAVIVMGKVEVIPGLMVLTGVMLIVYAPASCRLKVYECVAGATVSVISAGKGSVVGPVAVIV